MSKAETRPVRGYGLMLYSDGNREVCGFLDGSPVLVPARVERDGNRRRFRFSEGAHLLRNLGDVFCPDMAIAGFVREAINEKLERDCEAANAFRITGTKVSRRNRYLFVRVDVFILKTGESNDFTFVLEAPSLDVQEDGQREFGQLVKAVGLTEVEDSDELVGRTATFERHGEVVAFKTWAA
ncbi:hypothetical protein HT585_20585 [Ensifer sp. HO-A22]|uniref:Uncharacterized protein n=1 Tax=Ensifer oleiphilus TaxID=2742698 RepID=A0A7Y6Q910_9HYPH|nr:hypothetical protein [Ensifer oleiphilus]NVD41277.1 hypothetical protein [Ensifer oleiphilus]